MRTLPTRRELLFVLAFVISFTLFLQFGLGSSDGPQDSGSDWSRINVPWIGGNNDKSGFTTPGDAGRPKFHTEAPTQSLPDSSGVARESAFILENGKFPTTEVRVHVPGECCDST